MNWKESEIIDIASEGFFYEKSHPFSKGYIKLYPITARCEDILCNGSLIKRGLVLQTLMDHVLDVSVSIDHILQCDLDTILLNLKILSYGRDSKYKVKCNHCESVNEQVVSYGFRSKKFDFSNCIRGINELQYTFPKCGKTVKYRLPTNTENKIYLRDGWLTFIKNQTISIGGIEDIHNFYDYELPIADNKSFKKHYEDSTPGFNTLVNLTCPSCREIMTTKICIDEGIFGVTPETKKLTHGEIFDLCYHSNGSFTHDVLYDMPVNNRQFYVNRLVELKTKEKSVNDAAVKGDKSPTVQVPNRPKIKK